MKKLYFLAFLIGGVSAANAQFTLTTANHGLITPATLTYHSFSTAPSPGAAGAGVTWDFSTSSFVTTSTVTEVYTTPTAGQSIAYPSTNIVMYDSNNDTTFLRQTSGATVDSLKITGLNFNTIPVGSIPFSDPILVLKYPFSYNDLPIGDNFTGSTASGTSTTDIDGYGTLKLPNGTFSAIRTYTKIEATIATPFGNQNLTLEDYAWFQQSQRNPLMKYRKITSLAVNETSAMANALYTGVEDLSSINSKITLYPNPAKDLAKLSIELEQSGNTSVEIYSNTGAVVFSQDLGNLAAGSHSLDLNTQDVAAGVYMIRVISNEKTGIKKLIIE